MTKTQLQTKLTEQETAHTQTINIFKQGHAKRDHTIKNLQTSINLKNAMIVSRDETIEALVLENTTLKDTIITMSEVIPEEEAYRFKTIISSIMGATAGASIYTIIGGAGVAIAGSAVGAGLATFAIVGGTVGLATHSIYKAIKGKENA